MLWLTSPVFSSLQNRPAPAAHYPAAGLFIGNDGLGGVVTRPDGVVCQSLLHPACPVLCLELPSPAGEAGPAGVGWMAALANIVPATRAALAADWERFGGHLDKTFAAEREFLPPDGRRDLAYAAARTAGAYGGRVGEGWLAVVIPRDKEAAIREAVTNILGVAK